MTEEEILLSVLEKRLDFLNTVANVSMLWWVSSVVFCGTIIAAVWLQKERILETEDALFTGLFGTVSVFFGTIIIYGYWTISSVKTIEKQIAELLEQLDQLKIIPAIHETTGIIVAVAIGTTSFAFILVAWIVLWRTWSKERRSIFDEESDDKNA